MSITKAQVADLREGDVVEYHHWDWPGGITVRGALYKSQSGCLMIGNDPIRLEDGDVRSGDYWKGTLTVVSRAPRPLYVNSDRTEPAPGDVVREEIAEDDQTLWLFDSFGTWHSKDSTCRPEHMEGPLRLLVDGTTGQVVPS